MPIVEFICTQGHVTEEVILSREEADTTTETVCNHDCTLCPPDPEEGETHACMEPATRVDISLPAPGVFLGDGFYKPSPSGRWTTKNEDASKVVKEAAQELRAANGGKLPTG